MSRLYNTVKILNYKVEVIQRNAYGDHKFRFRHTKKADIKFEKLLNFISAKFYFTMTLNLCVIGLYSKRAWFCRISYRLHITQAIPEEYFYFINTFIFAYFFKKR